MTIHDLIGFVLHIDRHLDEFVRDNGAWTYGLTALIVFCETGLVITPFLPGDSLLFAAGAITAREHSPLNIWVLCGVLTVAAILGDAVNYSVGKLMAKRVLAGGKIPFVKQAHLDRTHAFFEKYGPKTIVIARFVPIVRTLAPFVAGVGQMSYAKFALYNILGAILWVGICCGAGYWFGNKPFVQKNFSVVVLGIIVVSLVPMVVEFALARRRARMLKRQEPPSP
jgi:membrane-associated protein